MFKKLLNFKTILIILLIVGVYYLFKISNQLDYLTRHSVSSSLGNEVSNIEDSTRQTANSVDQMETQLLIIEDLLNK